MSRSKQLIVTGCSLFFLWILLFAVLPQIQIRFHLNALRRAQKELPTEQSVEAMTESTRYQKVQNYQQQIHALIKLGYLEQKEIPFQHVVLTGAVKSAFIKLAKQNMPTNNFWVLNFSTNYANVSVTCRPRDMEKWEKLKAEFDQP